MGHKNDRLQVSLVLEDLALQLLQILLLHLHRPAQQFEISLMGTDALIVLLAQTSLLFYFGEVGVQAFSIAVAMEGVHSLLPRSLLFHDMVASFLNGGRCTALVCNLFSKNC